MSGSSSHSAAVRRPDIGLVAAAFSGGQSKKGVEKAPSHILESGLLESLRDDLEFTVHWDNEIHHYTGLLPETPEKPLVTPDTTTPLNNAVTVSCVTHTISKQTYEHASQGRIVITLGGDHSIAIGSIAGVSKAIHERRMGMKLAVIWIDAHADINTPKTTMSGNLHGMPLAWLTGVVRPQSENEPLFGWITEDHMIDRSNVVYIGLRDVDPAEREILRQEKIRAFTMHDVDKHGISNVIEMALQSVSCGVDQKGLPIHLSLDIDALDPAFAPSTGTPVPGGLTLREARFICEAIHDTGYLVSMDLVEVNPELGEGRKDRTKTVDAACMLIRSAVGDTLL